MSALKNAVIVGGTVPGLNDGAATNWGIIRTHRRAGVARELVDLRDYPSPSFDEAHFAGYGRFDRTQAIEHLRVSNYPNRRPKQLSIHSAIRVADNSRKNQFEVFVDGTLAGLTAYRAHGDDRAFVRTEIDLELRSRGLGSQLVRAAMNDVLRRQLRVLPYCPFVCFFIAQHPDTYLSLVPVEQRSYFGL